MKSKKVLLIGFITFVLTFRWIFLNRTLISTIEATGLVGLKKLLTTGSGYNAMQNHCTVYVLLYLILLSLYIPKRLIQHMVRRKRISLIIYTYKQVLLSAFLFSLIFTAIETVCITVFEPKKLLIESAFYIGVCVSLIIRTLYYCVIGAVFHLIETAFFSSSKALIFTFICYATMYFIRLIYHIWIPAELLEIYVPLMENRMNAVTVLVAILELIIIIGALLYGTYVVLKDKDVLNETV